MAESEIPAGWTKFDGQERPFSETARFDVMWPDGSVYEDAGGWEWDFMMTGEGSEPDALAFRLSETIRQQ